MSIFKPRDESKSSIAGAVFSSEAVHAAFILAIVALTVAAFYSTLHNGFLDYDDNELYLGNPNYRGLAWKQVRWMFTTFLMGHYQPLTWVTLGLDYIVWGMDPFGYHLTNLILHCLNGILFYLLAVRLLSFSNPRGTDLAVVFGAATAAILFSIHPLRVESVAWVTERRDVLSGVFFLLTLHGYLTAVRAETPLARKKWLLWTLAVYVLSLLSKAIGMALPAVLLILDVYPLRRLGGSKGRWFGEEVRPVWVEKAPFVVVAAVAAGVAAAAQHDSGAMSRLTQYGIVPRLAQAVYAFGFYIWKTLVPLKISPLYEVPRDFDPTQWMYAACALAIAAITAALIYFRKRWPSALAAWLFYLAMVLPVSGIAQSGPQLVAARYSYLSCLGFALLAGGGAARLWRHRKDYALTAFAGAVALTIVVVGLTYLTQRQVRVWHDTEGLWKFVLTVDPGATIPENDLGNILIKRGEVNAAIERYRRAIINKPENGAAHFNLAAALVRLGRNDEAIEEYRQSLKYSPSARAYYNLAFHLSEKGQLDEAIDSYVRAIQIDPGYVNAYNNVGRVLFTRGRIDEATEYYRKAIAIQPKFAMAHANLGYALVLQGRLDEGAKYIDRALEIEPELPTAHYGRGAVLMRKRRFAEAIEEYNQAVQENPEYHGAYYDIGNAYFELGKFKEAIGEYTRFLQANPNHATAHFRLANAWFNTGKVDQAVQEYRRTIAIDPKFAEAYANLGNALETRGDMSGAVQEYRRALAANQGQTPAHYSLANALRKDGDLDGAIREYRRAIDLDPKYLEARTNLASALDEQDKKQEAVEQYRQVLKIDPKYVPALFNLAIHVGEEGDADGAVERLRRVVQLAPHDAEAHFHLARYLTAEDRREEAALEFRQALKLQPGFAAAKESLDRLAAPTVEP